MIIKIIIVKAASQGVFSRRRHSPKHMAPATWAAVQGNRLGPTEFMSLSSLQCKQDHPPPEPSLTFKS